MNRNFLPYEINVETITYQTQAFPLGMIKPNIKKYDEWLSKKYIDYYYHMATGRFSIHDEESWREEANLIKEESWLYLDVDICDLVKMNKERINNQYYILGMYNEFYIPGKGAFNNRDFTHGYVIWGYDDNLEVFKSAGYLGDGRYQYFDIKYDDYYNSIISCDKKKFFLRYCQVKSGYVSELDVSAIKKKLINYLRERNDENHVYGFKTMDIFKEYVDNIGNNELDLRYGRMYMEHKYLMYKRLDCLEKNGYMRDITISNEYMNNVYTLSKVIFNLFIKYNIAQSRTTINQMMDLISRINNNELYLIEKCINKL